MRFTKRERSEQMLSEAKQKLIRKRLSQKVPAKDIAQEAQVSLRTIQNYKKKLPYNVYSPELDSGDNAIKVDYSGFLTKQEEKYTKRLQGALQLYEDEIEGWCYHLHKDDVRRRTSGLWWVAVAYPESVPENWIEKLKATGLEAEISPLHDKDKWSHDSPEMVNGETGEIIPKGHFYKFGDRKKAHWHIIIKSEKRMSYVEANALIRSITNGPYIQKCRSLKNAHEYHTHLNHPEKYQGYDKDEIIVLNGFHLEPNKYEAGIMQDEILGEIRDRNVTEFYELTDLYRGQPEYIQIIASKPGIFTSLIKSLWLKQHPERVTKVQIVKMEE